MSRPNQHTQTAGESFQALLPSKPIQLPFEGSYARIQVVYNMDRVMELPARRARLLRVQNDLVDELAKRQDIRNREFDATWDDYRKLREKFDQDAATAEESAAFVEQEAAYLAAWRAYTDIMADEADEMKAINRDASLALIAFVVSHLVWPFPEAAPDPEKPETWAIFSDTVLHWMVGPEGGLKLATEQMRSPLAVPK